MRRRHKLGLLLAAVILLPVLLLGWLTMTRAGLQLTLNLAAGAIPGELAWERMEGRLIGPLRAEGLQYSGPKGDYRLQDLDLDWSPLALMHGQLEINRLHAAGIRLEPAAAPREEEAPAQPPAFPPELQLPFTLQLADVALRDVRIVTPDGGETEIQELRLAMTGSAQSVTLERLELAMPTLQVTADGRLGLARNTRSELAFDWQADLPELPVYAGRGGLAGDWEALTLNHRLTRPAQVQLELQLQQPFAALQWSLQARLPETPLARFASGLPPDEIGAELNASGDLDSARLEAVVTTDRSELQGLPLRIHGRVAQTDWNRFDFEQVQLTAGATELRAEGYWALASESGRVELDWPKLQWPLADGALLVAESGRAQWEGGIDGYNLSMETRVDGPSLPAGQWRLRGEGDLKGFALNRLQADLLDGSLSAQGEVGWQPALSWDLTLQAEGIDPAEEWPDWPGSLSAQAGSQGRIEGEILSARLRLASLDGTLRDYPIRAEGALHIEDANWRIEALSLRTGENRLWLAGGLTQSDGLQWELNFPDLNATFPGVYGRLASDGTLTGRWPASRLAASFDAQNLVYAEARLDQASGRVATVLNDPAAPIDLELEGQNWVWQGRQLQTVTADLSGSLAQHSLQLDASGQSHGLKLQAQGAWEAQAWTGVVSQLDWRLPETGAWQLASPMRPRIAQAATAIDTSCWRQDQAELCLQASAGAGFTGWEGSARLTGLPVNRFEAWLPPAVSITSELTAEMSFAQRENQLVSEGRAGISAGEVSWEGEQAGPPLPLGPGEVNWALDAQGLNARAELALLQEDSLTARLRLPDFQPTQVDTATQPVQAELDVEIEHLEVVELFVTQVRQVEGRLLIDADVNGTLGSPRIQARAELLETSLVVPEVGIQITDIGLEVVSAPNGPIRLTGQAHSGEGQLGLDGTVQLSEGLGWRAALSLEGKDFLVLNIPQARLPVSPDLSLTVEPPRMDLTGEVRIDQARLEPRDFGGAVAPSRDVVVVTETQEKQEPRWLVSSRVTLILGDKVEFDGYGLVGRFGGRLQILDEPGQTTRANGELQVLDGTYTAYGQELEIEQGRIFYSGGPIDNPAIDATAVRRVDDVTAGIRLSGFLQQPEFELFSKPPMGQADALSYLMLGRPVSGASSSQGQLLMRAASALGMKGSNALAAQIGETLGLDEVAVEGGETAEEASLVLGKYLSPRLYVNYSMGLFETVSTLKLRYELSRRWTLETQVGSETGGDLLYSIER